MQAVSEEMDAAMPDHAPGDNRWWGATTQDGAERLVRMQYFHTASPTTRAVLADDRLLRLTGVTADGPRRDNAGGASNRAGAGADAESGVLRVVAGSHRALIQPAFGPRDLDLPQVDLPTRTGDVPIH